MPKPRMKSVPQFICNVSEEEYCKMVEKTKEYIKKRRYISGGHFQEV